MTTPVKKRIARFNRLKVNIGSEEAPNYVVVKGLSKIEMPISQTEVDTSDFDSDGCTSYALVSPGRDGLFEHDHARAYFEEPEPSMVGAARYDADLIVVDGVVVRDP